MALVTLLGDDMHLEERVKYGVEQKLNVGGVSFIVIKILSLIASGSKPPSPLDLPNFRYI